MRRLCADDGLELERIMRAAGQAGLATSLDTAEPDHRIGEVDWHRLLARVLPHVDVFMPSLGEIEAMLGTPRPWDGVNHPDVAWVRLLAESVLGLGAGIFGLKLGRFGLYHAEPSTKSAATVTSSLVTTITGVSSSQKIQRLFTNCGLETAFETWSSTRPGLSTPTARK